MLVFRKMLGKKDIWDSRYYIIPKIYMTIAGVWPYHRLRDRCVRFVPMFTFCFSILIPQVHIFNFENYTLARKQFTTDYLLYHCTIFFPSSIKSWYMFDKITNPIQLLYVLNAMDLDGIFEGLPSVLISITFSYKIAMLMLNSKHVSNHYTIWIWRNLLYTNYWCDAKCARMFIQIKSCLKMIEEDWLSLNSDVERIILARHSEYGRYLTIFYAGTF